MIQSHHWFVMFLGFSSIAGAAGTGCASEASDADASGDDAELRRRRPPTPKDAGVVDSGTKPDAAPQDAGASRDSGSTASDSGTGSTGDGGRSISAGAQGFGAGAVGGGNSSTVYHVTTLTGTGPGSLGYGIGSSKTIVFDVSGTINGKSGIGEGRYDLTGISYLTIDANGHDVTINNNNNGDGFSFAGKGSHHNILKGIRVTNAGGDGINVVDGAHDILITHCSSYGNRDGNIDIAASNDTGSRTTNVTVQYSILGGGAPSSDFSGAMLVTAQNVSVHHNFFSPASVGNVGERCPLIHASYSPVGSPNADFRNNLVWKFGRNNATGSGYGTDVAYGASANVVGNYYYSPSDPTRAVVANGSYGNEPAGFAFVSGNVSGNSGVNPNSAHNHAEYTISAAFAVATQDACTAARAVLASSGPAVRNATEQAMVSAVTLPGCP
ncbi:MAG: hypothetical protein U0174_14185 [Polyangiaceae bacterium]